jgi:hypothetical protein
LQHVWQYIHLNAAELFESGWKSGKAKNISALEKKLQTYDFSSLPDYLGKRPESSIISDVEQDVFPQGIPTFSQMIRDVHQYNEETSHIL